MVNLEPQELDQARGALGEIERLKNIQNIRRFWPWQLMWIFFVMLTNSHNRRFLDWWIWSGFALFIVVVGFFSWRDYQGLKRRYPANLQLLQSLAAREGDSVYDLEVPPEEHPLLEKWNRRLEKRALLWRADRFLSGKSWREPQ